MVGWSEGNFELRSTRNPDGSKARTGISRFQTAWNTVLHWMAGLLGGLVQG